MGRQELPPMVDYIIPNGTTIIVYAIIYSIASGWEPCRGVIESFFGSTYAVRLDTPWYGQPVGYFDRNRVRPANALERLAKET
jgi:hypothetical protein